MCVFVYEPVSCFPFLLSLCYKSTLLLIYTVVQMLKPKKTLNLRDFSMIVSLHMSAHALLLQNWFITVNRLSLFLVTESRTAFLHASHMLIKHTCMPQDIAVPVAFLTICISHSFFGRRFKQITSFKTWISNSSQSQRC